MGLSLQAFGLKASLIKKKGAFFNYFFKFKHSNLFGFFSEPKCWYKDSFTFAQVSRLPGTVSQVSDVAHEPLVFPLMYVSIVTFSASLKLMNSILTILTCSIL